MTSERWLVAEGCRMTPAEIAALYHRLATQPGALPPPGHVVTKSPKDAA